MGAACCTHPLDTIKVRMQTNTAKLGGKQSVSFFRTGFDIATKESVFALYNGLSASLLRQATYSTTRFGVYEYLKQKNAESGKKLTLIRKIVMSCTSGVIGGIVGTPADVTNIRMQNDGKLPLEQRRNYKNAFDGLIKIGRAEGIKGLWSGVIPNLQRAMLMTAGQLATYDQFKYFLLNFTGGVFKDNLITHFSSSLLAGFVATLLTMPADVTKTRLMTAKPGTYRGSLHCFFSIVKNEGPTALMKGFSPAFTRLGPHTILTFIFLENLKKLFGYKSPEK
eukprot:TRINITY_DN961_c0_g1_i2.p1 TRINITY_DN961_c0_g1~~TRINITY_DN961_c0_g1_i2.p1  ORF type:complete len:280 (+),score=85.21 TRINITY_DN961_c0_g1_i2:166-1005(+)